MKFISLRKPFRRSNNFPLDMSSLFDSYEDALKYAKGSGDTRGLGITSYPGQIISVANNNDSGVSIYQIAYDRTLKEIGKGGSGSSVAWQQILTGGTQIAKISIDGTEQIVYAPTDGSKTEVQPLITSGTPIAIIKVNEEPTTIYSPNIEGDGNISATTIDNKVKLTLECISNPQIVIE